MLALAKSGAVELDEANIVLKHMLDAARLAPDEPEVKETLKRVREAKGSK